MKVVKWLFRKEVSQQNIWGKSRTQMIGMVYLLKNYNLEFMKPLDGITDFMILKKVWNLSKPIIKKIK